MDLEFDLIWHHPWCGDMSLKFSLTIVSHCSGQECNATVTNYLDFSTMYIMCSLDQFKKIENWSPWFHFWMFYLKLKQNRNGKNILLTCVGIMEKQLEFII